MKNVWAVVLCFFSCVVNASTFYSIDEIKVDYLNKISNEERDRRIPLKIEKVKHQQKDVNGDGRLDIAVFDYYHCGSSGCRADIYLCRNGAEVCSTTGYCFAARVMESEVKKKGKNLICD